MAEANPWIPNWRRGPGFAVAGIDCSDPDPAKWRWLTDDGNSPDGVDGTLLPFGPETAQPQAKTATRS